MQKKPSSTEQERPQIDYPCPWTYKVIGENRAMLREVIALACHPHAVIISDSHSSSRGKYHSLNAELVVPDEVVRLRIYETLKNSDVVKIVL